MGYRVRHEPTRAMLGPLMARPALDLTIIVMCIVLEFGLNFFATMFKVSPWYR